MSISAEDVSSKKFSTVRGFKEGYNLAEVDEFLEQVESTLRALQSRIDDLEQSRPSASASQVLELAQRTADSLLAEARSEADTLISHARDDAATTVDSLKHQVEALNAKIAELTMIERDYRSRLREFVSSTLGDIDA